MPVFDAHATEPFYRFPYKHCRVYDAAGHWVPFCRRVNTETGEVERYAVERSRGATGIRFVICPLTEKPRMIREVRPAPLTVTEYDPRRETYRPPEELR